MTLKKFLQKAKKDVEKVTATASDDITKVTATASDYITKVTVKALKDITKVTKKVLDEAEDKATDGSAAKTSEKLVTLEQNQLIATSDHTQSILHNCLNEEYLGSPASKVLGDLADTA